MLLPIIQNNFGLAEHRFSVFNAIVSTTLTSDTVTDPKLYVNIATKLEEGDEIRLVADDQSFVARVYVSFVRGVDVRVQLLEFKSITENEAIEEPDSPYEIKVCGAKKVCIIDKRDGSYIKEGLASKAVAERELSDYIRAMNR